MTNDQRERRGPFIGCLAIGMLLALPSYVLSIGPFVWLVRRGYMPREVGIVFWPLRVLVDSYPPIGLAFEWYLQFWQ